MRSSRWVGIAWAVLAMGPVAPGCAGAPPQHRYLATQPLPVEVHPAEPNWGVTIGADVRQVIRVHVVNRGTEAVHLLWDESAYIDVDERSHRVIPASAGPRGASMRATVAPKTRLDEVLVPVGGPQDSPLDPLLAPRGAARWWWPFSAAEVARIGSRVDTGNIVLGKSVGLFLTLERGGQRRQVLAKYALVGEALAAR